jgi:hypothetical protein
MNTRHSDAALKAVTLIQSHYKESRRCEASSKARRGRDPGTIGSGARLAQGAARRLRNLISHIHGRRHQHLFNIIAQMQLELFEWDNLSQDERDRVFIDIRRTYWHLRNLRAGRFGQADQRRHYRIAAAQKKRLLMAGVPKRVILDFLSCCRLQCSIHEPPFNRCPHCP